MAFELRASTREDTGGVLELLTQCDLHDFAVPDVRRGMLLGGWRVGEFNPGRDAVVAEADGTILGYAALFEPGAIAFVSPAHEGRGIGSGLLSWVEARAVEAGRSRHRQPVAEQNASGQTLLAVAGYERVRSVWIMAATLPVGTAVPPLPAGIALDLLDVERDAESLHAADAAAFAENPEYQPVAFQAFYDEHLGAAELDPALSRVARRGEEVVGFMLCRRLEGSVGYVDLLAVSKPERRQGLGTALLTTGLFEFSRAGLREAQLDVASDNPRAIRIYERAGMTPRYRMDVLEKLIG